MNREGGGLGARARRYGADAARAFELAPVEVSIALLLAVGFSFAVEQHDEPIAWLELGAVAALAGAAAWTGTLLHALGVWSARTRWIVTLAGAVVAGLYGGFVLDFRLFGEAWRAAALVAAAALWLLAVPALGVAQAEATDRFRLVNGRFLLRCLGVGLYALALYLGLALALSAVNTLFELRLEGQIYAHVFGWIFLVLVTWVVVGGLPDFVRPAAGPNEVASVVHRMSAYLVPPLLAVYFLILYAYAVRIAITGEVPKNLVSPMVLAAGILAVLALMLFDPRPGDRTSFRVLRGAGALFVPLSALGVWTVLTRVGQYGWTEFRLLRLLLLLALGALAVGSVLLLVRRRRFPLHLVPLSLAVLTLLAVVGPWNVLSVSRRSQQGRLTRALAAAQVRTDSAAAPRDTLIDGRVYEQIRSTSAYLATHFGPEALPPVLARHARGADRFTDLAARIGLRPDNMRSTSTDRPVFGRLQPGAHFPDPAGDVYYVVLEHSRDGDGDVISGRGVRSDSTRIWVRTTLGELTANLDSLDLALHNGLLTPDRARVPMLDAEGRVQGELLVLEVMYRAGPRRRLNRLEGLLRLAPP